MLKTTGLAAASVALAILTGILTEVLAFVLLANAPAAWPLVDNLFTLVVLPSALVTNALVVSVAKPLFLHNRILHIALFAGTLITVYAVVLTAAGNPANDIIRYALTVGAAFAVAAAWRLRAPPN